MMLGKFAKIAAVAFSAMLMMGLMAGCGSSSSGDSKADSNAAAGQSESKDNAAPEELTPDSHLFQLMDQLTPETTLEQANEIIGSEGELKSETSSSTYYVWDTGDDTSIEAYFFTSGSSRFDANFPTKLVADRADFSKWDEIESLAGDGELTYDKLVELLGGVPGLKESVRSGEYNYVWYNDDNGYLTGQVNSETGVVDMVSGMF